MHAYKRQLGLEGQVVESSGAGVLLARGSGPRCSEHVFLLNSYLQEEHALRWCRIPAGKEGGHMESGQAWRIGIGAAIGGILGGLLGVVFFDNLPLGIGIGAFLGALLGGAALRNRPRS